MGTRSLQALERDKRALLGGELRVRRRLAASSHVAHEGAMRPVAISVTIAHRSASLLHIASSKLPSLIRALTI